MADISPVEGKKKTAWAVFFIFKVPSPLGDRTHAYRL